LILRLVPKRFEANIIEADMERAKCVRLLEANAHVLALPGRQVERNGGGAKCKGITLRGLEDRRQDIVGILRGRRGFGIDQLNSEVVAIIEGSFVLDVEDDETEHVSIVEEYVLK
jgi:hypothetical protein